MAYIRVFNITEDSVDVRLMNLDDTYNNSTRYVKYSVYEYYNHSIVEDTDVSQIPNQVSTSPTRVLTGLQPDTRYEVEARIYNINDGTYPDVYLYEDFYTDKEPVFLIYPPSSSNWGISDVSETTITVWFARVYNATHTGVYVNGNHYNNYTGSSATITGLSPNTQYRINVDSYNSTEDVNSSLSDNKYATTDPLPLSPPTNISLYNPTASSFEWQATRDPNASHLRIYVSKGINPTILTSTTTSNGGAFTGRDANTTYYVRFRSYDSATGSMSAYSANYSITTLSNQLTTPVWDVSETQINFTYIYAEVDSVPQATSYVWELWNAAKSSRIAVITNSGVAVAWNGLDPNTSYNLRVMVKATGYLDSAWSSWYAITTHTATPWQWWSNVGQGDPFRITRAEWIAFQDRINTVRYGRGLAYYQFTTTFAAVSTGKPMTAALMNECIVAINDMLAVGNKMATVSTGQTISATFMEGIKNKLNSLM